MKDFLNNLNNSQLESTLQMDGPMIVIAGAGSGKTRVLTYKIAYLMTEGVDPFNILALTFTNKAAKEMKERIATIVGNEAKNLWMGTFHSVFARILRIEAHKIGYTSNFTIYDSDDSQKLVSRIIKEFNLDKDQYKYKSIFSRISSMKNSFITTEDYLNNEELLLSDKISNRSKFYQIYNEYVERCFRAGAMDFDDLLLKTNELLNSYPDTLSKYQNIFKYILVDEYQDTNHSQYLIIRALSDKFQNICVVGDDAQSIYSFRGANINNILNFQKDFPDSKIFRLEQNYRSTKNIVNAANSLIENNQKRLKKNVWTENESGEKISVNKLLTDGEEGRFVASSIFENKMQSQLKNSDFAILYRTNAQSRSFEDALRKKNISYRVYGGLSFYQRKEIKDVLAYLRLLINPDDEQAFKRIINFPARGIGQTTLNKIAIEAKNSSVSDYIFIKNHLKSSEIINNSTKNKLLDFVIMIESIKNKLEHSDVFDITKEVLKQSELYNLYKNDESLEGINRIQNIEELLNGIKDFIENNEKSQTSVSSFLQDVALATDQDNDTNDKNKVSLMTVHLAKGLEFPYVYIVGLEENLFPSAMNLNSRTELEEERRLFYVALTRAEKKIYLSYVLSRYRWGKPVDSEKSRFIDEIKVEYLQNNVIQRHISKDFSQKSQFNKVEIRYKKPEIRPSKNFIKLKSSSSKSNLFDNRLVVGNIVIHERFGKGEVVSIEGQGGDRKAEIKFEKDGLKKLLLRFSRLEIIS
ncbi:MAG: ATP-dependent DNA helicase [Flavobacteriaceae bacterium]|nr:ATP-dependent DNA helicase [Flavobacteriaceae bacterium]MAU31438.1 ATP-dependent DNA helicase [Flavobacteriaceae bacterium]